MASYKNVEIPSPFQNSSFHSQLRSSLQSSGFSGKKNYKDVKLVNAVKYWWPSYTMYIVGVGNKTFPGGRFVAYTYTYPQYKENRVIVSSGKTRSDNNYFDDSIEEVLGGNIEKLGGTR